MEHSTLFPLGLCFGVVLFAGSGASAQDLPACERFPVGEESYACECPGGAAAGSIWGTSIYTADSDICTAARHAGVIDQMGGGVLVLAREGQQSYSASTANGIESRSWAAYGDSFTFDPKGPRYVSAEAVPSCGRFDLSVESMRCSCPAGTPSGTVWGSGPYTADSDLCTAAQHAGVLDGMARTITVMRFPGLEAYVGSVRHGVSTRDWAAYGDSIIINANE